MKLKPIRFKNNEISAFLSSTNRIDHSLFTLYYRWDPSPCLAVIVPKRLGNACARNKVKRRLREALRDVVISPTPRPSLIIKAKKKIMNQPFQFINNMVLLTLKKKVLI